MHRKSALLGMALTGALLLFTACTPKGTQTGAPSTSTGDSGGVSQSDALSIPLADLTSDPQFFDWTSNGTAMQVIARLDSDGTPRLAYNTCQVCVGSPYAYFDLKDGWLVCQNCGNAFAPDSVGRVSGGCNPMPAAGYDVQADSVSLPAETLASVSPMFKNWKAIK